ncbi:hypothetical protein LguiA_012278 [Lonicera macranthoides]
MEANNFRFESHVAQQSRRDKLRINPQDTDASQHFHPDYNSNIENAKYGAVSYDPSVFHASGMLNYVGGPSSDWIENYSSNSTGVESSQNPNPIFGSSLYVKPSCYYQDVQSTLASSSNEISAHLHYNTPSFYHNTLQEVVTTATIGATHGVEMASLAQQTGRGSWVMGQNDSNELLLLPSYGDQSDPVRGNGAPNWVNRPVIDHSSSQGLSLSLSTKTHENLRPQSSVFNDLQDSKAPKLGFGNRVSGSTRMEISNITHPNTGPLGPFTGYATILKSSKYMKPTQEMLIEFCSANGSKTISAHEVYSEMIKEVRCSGGDVNADESMGGTKGRDSGGSSSTFYDSNEISAEVGGQNSSAESCRPEYQQKKAKLLYMQEEVLIERLVDLQLVRVNMVYSSHLIKQMVHFFFFDCLCLPENIFHCFCLAAALSACFHFFLTLHDSCNLQLLLIADFTFSSTVALSFCLFFFCGSAAHYLCFALLGLLPFLISPRAFAWILSSVKHLLAF